MTKVVADIPMSLDGFVTGPDPGLEHVLGIGGEPLHSMPLFAGSRRRPLVQHAVVVSPTATHLTYALEP